jgi:hypothetical protein
MHAHDSEIFWNTNISISAFKHLEKSERTWYLETLEITTFTTCFPRGSRLLYLGTLPTPFSAWLFERLGKYQTGEQWYKVTSVLLSA